MFGWGTATAPTGYLLCDGTAVSRATYALLFSIIGTTFGAGNGSTTFNIPDLRANAAVGYKSGDANFGTLGAAVGAATVASNVTVATQPTFTVDSHTHALSSAGWAQIDMSASTLVRENRVTATSWTSTNNFAITRAVDTTSGLTVAAGLGGATDATAGTTTTRTANVALTNNATSVVQQSLTVNWIIKY
jgi:microcystin-dependent protein